MSFNFRKKIPLSIALIVIILVGVVTVAVTLNCRNIVRPEGPILQVDTSSQEVKTGEVALENSSFFQELQSKVDQGDQTWRLDPVQVAKNNGDQYGFIKTDEFKLENKQLTQDGNNKLAFVVASHNGEDYIIQLVQPVKLGSNGIWAIQKIRKKLAGVPVEWEKCRGRFYEIRYPHEFTVSSDCRVTSTNLETNYLLEINSQPIPSEASVEQWIKTKLPLNEVKEFEKDLTTRANKVDRVKEVKIGEDIPGYFVHSWGPEGNRGVCMYVGESRGRLIKIRVTQTMQEDLRYSTCLNNQILNQVISSLRLLSESDY